jgi:manganese-dependent ADP-ribose/CDP-alcohol diphosphatase
MKQLVLSLITIIIIQASCSQSESDLRIGLVADPQYADNPTAGKRYYRESLWKLKEAIVTFNDNDVDFVQNLGDIIDKGWENYDSIIPVYQHLKPGIDNYHLLGNHDYAIDSSHLANLLETLSMPDFYYSYVKKTWRFIVLDATDYSYFSNSIHKHDTNQINSYFESTNGKPNNYSWNSAIGKKQQNWLKQELEDAELLKQKVIVFSHMPLRPLNSAENLWNNEEIIDIIENSSNVVAFINGHNHAGDYVFKNGIHYITILGMVDTMINSYGILEIYKNSLVLRGYGNQKSFNLTISE